ncbi:uncharacterized protein LOC134929354 isoform X2 [Pseudophryne corroboree]|uniref:uncharacterized protein LOC134929354 isoform X2 n=1 Tax=Pseudophryne corroboree TaxID=495146 RepID=UPI003081D571
MLERCTVAEPLLKRAHPVSRVLSRIQDQTVKLPSYFSHLHLSELRWRNTPSQIQKNVNNRDKQPTQKTISTIYGREETGTRIFLMKPYSAICKGNPDMPSIHSGIPGTRVNRLPHLPCTGYSLCASHHYRDRCAVGTARMIYPLREMSEILPLGGAHTLGRVERILAVA